MRIVIIEDSIAIGEVKELAKEFYVSMIKGVVDVESEIFALGGEYHMDANIRLLENGSEQQDIWGFNLLLDKLGDEWLEYTSLINIRPLAGNNSMEIVDSEIRDRVRQIINKKVKR